MTFCGSRAPSYLDRRKCRICYGKGKVLVPEPPKGPSDVVPPFEPGAARTAIGQLIEAQCVQCFGTGREESEVSDAPLDDDDMLD